MNHAEDIALQEKAIVREILENGTSLEEFLFFRDSLSRNQDLKDIPQCDGLTLVGGGALPSTAFTLLSLNKVKDLTIVDVDSEALELAEMLFKINQLKATFVHCSGSDFDYSATQGIYVANLVQNKEQTLKRCELTAPPGTWLTIRFPTAGLLGVDVFSPEKMDKEVWSFKFKGNDSKEFKSCNYHFQKSV